jgi:hypothetical protein
MVQNKKNVRPNVAYPQVLVGQRVQQPLDKFQATFGGRIRFNRAISQYFWFISGTMIRPCLEEMLPHLEVKRPQAELAIEWVALAQGWLQAEGKVQAGRAGFPIDIAARRLNVLNAICRLNGRGSVVNGAQDLHG